MAGLKEIDVYKVKIAYTRDVPKMRNKVHSRPYYCRGRTKMNIHRRDRVMPEYGELGCPSILFDNLGPLDYEPSFLVLLLHVVSSQVLPSEFHSAVAAIDGRNRKLPGDQLSVLFPSERYVHHIREQGRMNESAARTFARLMAELVRPRTMFELWFVFGENWQSVSALSCNECRMSGPKKTGISSRASTLRNRENPRILPIPAKVAMTTAITPPHPSIPNGVTGGLPLIGIVGALCGLDFIQINEKFDVVLDLLSN
ncbi:hypothetical protein CRG98_025676 [Punica granatum]|uniref:Uncharacterized protein n=1 Tax=Punica granatum TaxID=22663 RepID=A0A2I0JCB2_PUNGR|nr:hypothetical protein CRG98_025676 [Punica granatum]